MLGSFAHDHLAYRLDEASKDEPTLIEMTRQALNILKKNENGFLLVIEGEKFFNIKLYVLKILNFLGGNIDSAHHETWAQKSLVETVHFHETVEFVQSQIDENETLLVVTADHSHVFTVGGYPVNISIVKILILYNY